MQLCGVMAGRGSNCRPPHKDGHTHTSEMGATSRSRHCRWASPSKTRPVFFNMHFEHLLQALRRTMTLIGTTAAMPCNSNRWSPRQCKEGQSAPTHPWAIRPEHRERRDAGGCIAILRNRKKSIEPTAWPCRVLLHESKPRSDTAWERCRMRRRLCVRVHNHCRRNRMPQTVSSNEDDQRTSRDRSSHGNAFVGP